VPISHNVASYLLIDIEGLCKISQRIREDKAQWENIIKELIGISFPRGEHDLTDFLSASCLFGTWDGYVSIYFFHGDTFH
jgi:hypothetical protein